MLHFNQLEFIHEHSADILYNVCVLLTLVTAVFHIYPTRSFSNLQTLAIASIFENEQLMSNKYTKQPSLVIEPFIYKLKEY